MPHHYTLAPFQYRFLCAVKDLDRGAYGVNILDWLVRDTRSSINVGQVYTGAQRLVQCGLLSYESVAVHGGKRPALVYRLTEHGERELAETAAQFRSRAKSTNGAHD